MVQKFPSVSPLESECPSSTDKTSSSTSPYVVVKPVAQPDRYSIQPVSPISISLPTDRLLPLTTSPASDEQQSPPTGQVTPVQPSSPPGPASPVQPSSPPSPDTQAFIDSLLKDDNCLLSTQTPNTLIPTTPANVAIRRFLCVATPHPTLDLSTATDTVDDSDLDTSQMTLIPSPPSPTYLSAVIPSGNTISAMLKSIRQDLIPPLAPPQRDTQTSPTSTNNDISPSNDDRIFPSPAPRPSPQVPIYNHHMNISPPPRFSPPNRPGAGSRFLSNLHDHLRPVMEDSPNTDLATPAEPSPPLVPNPPVIPPDCPELDSQMFDPPADVSTSDPHPDISDENAVKLRQFRAYWCTSFEDGPSMGPVLCEG